LHAIPSEAVADTEGMGGTRISVRQWSVAVTLLVCGADLLIANRLRADAFARQVPTTEIPEAAEQQERQLLAKTRRAGAAWMHATNHARWSIRSRDGIELVGYYFPWPIKSEKCVLLVHGHNASSENMGVIAAQYHERQFNVLMIDSRGHGQSGGCYSGLGWLEWQDCTLWIDRIVGELGAGTPVILHGISMGANTLLNAAGEGLPNEVRAIIADSPFTSVRAIMTYRLHKHHIPAMPILISAALLNLTGERHQIFGADTRKQVARSRVPTLFIHSQADRQNPPRMSQQLHDRAAGFSELWITGDAPHGMLFATEKATYATRVFEFIQRALALGD
jgi:alpha-beta hydrolase superfamily lysophospholipase